MKNIKSLRTLKFVLPAIAGLCILFAFSDSKREIRVSKKALSVSTLHFKYTPPSTNDYSTAAVESAANWSQIPANQACAQETNEAACSFSIDVPMGDEADFVNSSGKPTSRVDIRASTGSDSYVTDVKDATNSSSLTRSIENVYLP